LGEGRSDTGRTYWGHSLGSRGRGTRGLCITPAGESSREQDITLCTKRAKKDRGPEGLGEGPRGRLSRVDIKLWGVNKYTHKGVTWEKARFEPFFYYREKNDEKITRRIWGTGVKGQLLTEEGPMLTSWGAHFKKRRRLKATKRGVESCRTLCCGGGEPMVPRIGLMVLEGEKNRGRDERED